MRHALAVVLRPARPCRVWPACLALALCCLLPAPHTHAGDRDSVYTAATLPAAFTQDEAREVTLVFVGDIMVGDRCATRAEAEGPDSIFAATAPLLRRADLTIGNLEGPVASRAAVREGRWRYRMAPGSLASLQHAGFDLLSLANNHVMDCDDAGLLETLGHLRQARMAYVGAGANRRDAQQPRIATLGGTRIAFVAAVCPETWHTDSDAADVEHAYDARLVKMAARFEADSDEPGAVVATPAILRDLVEKAQAQADLVVVYLHAGIRYQRLPTPQQRALAHAAIKAGADLVVGHHAHIWQPVETYDEVPILYGLGNFAFGSANNNADEGLLARVHLEGKRFTRVELFPLYTRNQDLAVGYQPKILAGADARSVIADLARESAVYNAAIRFRDGRGHLQIGAAGDGWTTDGDD